MDQQPQQDKKEERVLIGRIQLGKRVTYDQIATQQGKPALFSALEAQTFIPPQVVGIQLVEYPRKSNQNQAQEQPTLHSHGRPGGKRLITLGRCGRACLFSESRNE
jgi:hypothetical protein